MLTKDGWEIASKSVDGTGEEKEDLAAAEQLRRIVRRITLDEFRWQDAHYDADSQRGRELLFLYANNEWVRATAEIVDVTRSDPGLEKVTVPVDQWRSQSELGRAENHPLVQAHFREQDRAGALVDVLDALGHVFQYDMQPTFGRGEWKVWHAQMQVTSGRTAHTRLTTRLNTAARRAAQITFNEIEYKITEAARKAAAVRTAAHYADRGWDPPEYPVISISLITAPGHELGTPEQG